MDIKRILTTVVGLPLVVLLIIFGNMFLMDTVVAVIAIIAMYEYSKCSGKEVKFIAWVGYLAAASLAFIHIVPEMVLNTVITLGVPIILFFLFFSVIVTNMKITFKDVAFSFVGILYIVGFLGFLAILYGVTGKISGKYLVWFVILNAWGTDVFAYLVGKHFGKHKFSVVSPNKTIEGCIGGMTGAVVFSLICAYIMNTYFGTEIVYSTIGIISVILSIVGQIGDFSASVIKRYFGIKDFSELFPGHGGMIDRVDSVMFIAPFAYFLLTMFL